MHAKRAGIAVFILPNISVLRYSYTHLTTKRKNEMCMSSLLPKSLINCDFKRLNNIYSLADVFSELVSCPHALSQPTSTILFNSEKCFAYRVGCCANPFAQHCRYNCSVLFQLQQLTANNFTEVSQPSRASLFFGFHPSLPSRKNRCRLRNNKWFSLPLLQSARQVARRFSPLVFSYSPISGFGSSNRWTPSSPSGAWLVGKNADRFDET